MKKPDSLNGETDSPTKNTATYELTGLPLILVMTGLGLTTFHMPLDGSIIATAIPKITSQFHSTDDIAWFGSAYSFAMCALQPTAGKLFASFTLKWTFLACLGIFELGSLICALAINSPMLIIGRAIAGAAAAGCATGAFCIVAVSAPLSKRPLLIGILQSTYGIATIIGPILGGALTEHATWRWCFWINLPIGAITVITIILFFKPTTSGNPDDKTIWQKLEALDFVGFSLFAPAIIMVFLALQWGESLHPWKSATIIGLLAGGGILGIIFALWQWYRGDHAMIPPRIITERTMFFACSTEFFAMGASFVSIYYLPEWFQVIKNASLTKSGLMYLPLALSDVLSATVTGTSLTFLGYPNLYILLRTALMSIATGLFSTFSEVTNHKNWISYKVLQGLGVGMTLSMPYVATQTILKPEDIPVATALLQCFQFFGASVWLAVAEAIFGGNKLTGRLREFKFTQAEIQQVISAGAAEVRRVTSETKLPDVISAYNTGITTTFYIGVACATVAFFLSLGIKWRSVKPPKPTAGEVDIDTKV